MCKSELNFHFPDNKHIFRYLWVTFMSSVEFTFNFHSKDMFVCILLLKFEYSGYDYAYPITEVSILIYIHGNNYHCFVSA